MPQPDATSGDDSGLAAGDAPATDAGDRPDPDGSRLRFADLETERLPSSGLRIGVRLTHRGDAYRGEAEGVGSRVVELRLSARATLEAVHRALSGAAELELVGLKQVHAFDADLVLVAVRTAADPGRRLVGAVPVVDDHCAAAVRATLDAVNRVLAPHLDEA